MNNRTLYFGSAAGTELGESFPFSDLQGREMVEAYACIVETSLQKLPSGFQFALIELVEFLESSDRRSSSGSSLPLAPAYQASASLQHYPQG